MHEGRVLVMFALVGLGCDSPGGSQSTSVTGPLGCEAFAPEFCSGVGEHASAPDWTLRTFGSGTASAADCESYFVSNGITGQRTDGVDVVIGGCSIFDPKQRLDFTDCRNFLQRWDGTWSTHRDLWPLFDACSDYIKTNPDGSPATPIPKPDFDACGTFAQSWCDAAFTCFDQPPWSDSQRFIVGFESLDADGQRREEGFDEASCRQRLVGGGLFIETDGNFSRYVRCRGTTDYENCASKVQAMTCDAWAAWIKIGDQWGNALTECMRGPDAP